MVGSKLRVGVVDYLNAWPLAWGLLTGACEDAFDAVYLPPAEVADQLAIGRIDIGLVPSIEVQRLDDLLVIPGLCVAATHEVQSVILISRLPMKEIRRVALDRNSRTSAALVQILLHDRYGIVPEVEVASPDAEEMLARADAALIIGDPALRVDRGRYRVWDLAAEWRALTGRPFVFAVWAARRALGDRLRDVPGRLAASLESGLDHLDEIVERAGRELGLGASIARPYLTANLSYHLDAEALAGLSEFYRRASELGLLETVTDLDLLDPPSAAEPATHGGLETP